MSAIEKKFIPTECPGCACLVLSDEFYCTDCAYERAEERELDQEMEPRDER
jgi:hypothetical protein